MGQSVFKANAFSSIVLPILITSAILIGYFVADNLPPWILILLIVPIVFAINGQKNKIIITEGRLRYEKVFGTEEVPLSKVAHIVIREIETIVDHQSSSANDSFRTNRQGFNQPVNQERKIEKLYYVLDESGRTFFSFPARLVGFQDRQRFEEAVHAVNPTIELF